MYYLVTLAETGSATAPPIEHEPFIDALIRRHAVLLGGAFEPHPLPGVTSAYVLRCENAEQAREIVAEDPLVASGRVAATIARWDLVGVDLAAIDPDVRLDSAEDRRS